MKVSELLKYVDEDAIVVFSHFDAQNIGYGFVAKDVPTEVQSQTICEISADNSQLSIIVC